MPIPEDALRAMEEAAHRQGGRPYADYELEEDIHPARIIALIAAYREQGRELDTYKMWADALNFDGLHKYQHSREDHCVRADPGGSILDWAVAELSALRKALTETKVAASARIDEIAALTAERDAVRVERTNEWRKRRDAEGSRDAAKAACGSLRADRASLTALLNKTRDNLTKYTRILRGPSYVEGCVGLEVDRSILDETRALLAEIEAALPPIPSATKETP